MMTGGALARGACGTGPGCFAVVMGTGIVSAALRQVGHPRLSGVLLAIAAASFVTLVAVSAWRAALFPAALRADLACPGRAFACFAFVAACAMLGDRLAGDGHRYPAAALAGGGAAGLAVPDLPGSRADGRPAAHIPPITRMNGSWYLWAVATLSLAVAAAYLQAAGLLPAQPAAMAAR